jgi:hypothetical protein
MLTVLRLDKTNVKTYKMLCDPQDYIEGPVDVTRPLWHGPVMLYGPHKHYRLITTNYDDRGLVDPQFIRTSTCMDDPQFIRKSEIQAILHILSTQESIGDAKDPTVKVPHQPRY